MRIWDINPGYLNRQSLLGEHRELHGVVSILVHGKKGYANHPETLRWVDYGWALATRHKQLVCEMALRGYTDRSPVTTCGNEGVWPEVYIDEPARQFQLLREKYTNKEKGRIALPTNVQQLWAQHKYSVQARDQNVYREIGRRVADKQYDFAELALLLTQLLRQTPAAGSIRNAVQHIWGYVSGDAATAGNDINEWSLQRLLLESQKQATATNNDYLLASTALSELMVWLS